MAIFGGPPGVSAASSVRSGLRALLAFAETRARLAANEFEIGFSLWRAWVRLSAVLDRFAPPQPVARRAH